MYAKRFLAIASLAAFGVASPTPDNPPASGCITGDLLCCETVVSSGFSPDRVIVELQVNEPSVTVGAGCAPRSVSSLSDAQF